MIRFQYVATFNVLQLHEIQNEVLNNIMAAQLGEVVLHPESRMADNRSAIIEAYKIHYRPGRDH